MSHASKIVVLSNITRNYQCYVFSWVMWISLVRIWERDVKFNVAMIKSCVTSKAGHSCWICSDWNPSTPVPMYEPSCRLLCRQQLGGSWQVRFALVHGFIPSVVSRHCEAIPADTHSRGIPAESHSSENQRNFPLRLLISKRVAWIITQISLGSRISGTDKDKADQLYQIS